MKVDHKRLFTTIQRESGLAFSTDAGCADLHGLSDLGLLCSLGCGLQKKGKSGILAKAVHAEDKAAHVH